VSTLLIATAAFSADEIAVALELFDETFSKSCRFSNDEGTSPVAVDYEFIGVSDVTGRLLGYACFGPTPATDGTYDLYWLAVHPAAQGRGVGRALVRWVEQELGRRGARLLVVETSSRTDYAHTREFYARGGYVEAARVLDFYAPADDRIILTTRLRAREVGVATR
jgi:GNAT superfamily N-acetyltransferase